MSIETKGEKLVLKATRHYDLIFISVIGITAVIGLIHFALTYGYLVFYLSIPASVLIAIGLLIYVPYKLYFYTTTSIDEIILDENGVTIRNKKLNILDTIKWIDVIDIIVSQSNNDETPEKITIICYNRAEKVNLKLYHTVLTSTEEIWKKAVNIYKLYKTYNETS